LRNKQVVWPSSPTDGDEMARRACDAAGRPLAHQATLRHVGGWRSEAAVGEHRTPPTQREAPALAVSSRQRACPEPLDRRRNAARAGDLRPAGSGSRIFHRHRTRRREPVVLRGRPGGMSGGALLVSSCDQQLGCRNHSCLSLMGPTKGRPLGMQTLPKQKRLHLGATPTGARRPEPTVHGDGTTRCDASGKQPGSPIGHNEQICDEMRSGCRSGLRPTPDAAR